MENDQRQDNNMGSTERNHGMNIHTHGSKYPSLETPNSAHYVMLDITSQPFLHFHDVILSDYMHINSIEKRIAAINKVRAQLIEELNNIYLLKNQLQDLMNRYQQIKKS